MKTRKICSVITSAILVACCLFTLRDPITAKASNTDVYENIVLEKEYQQTTGTGVFEEWFYKFTAPSNGQISVKMTVNGYVGDDGYCGVSLSDTTFSGDTIDPLYYGSLSLLNNGTSSTTMNIPAGECWIDVFYDSRWETVGVRTITYSFSFIPSTDGGVPMYRCYNEQTGEHFYTSNANEAKNITRKVLNDGIYWSNEIWTSEGIGWFAPEKSDKPVYRLYNPNSGDHHYTTSASEKDMLVTAGWNYENIGWYSAADTGKPLYRQYNPNAVTGNHNYTTSRDENNDLVQHGWIAEGIGWYGL